MKEVNVKGRVRKDQWSMAIGKETSRRQAEALDIKYWGLVHRDGDLVSLLRRPYERS